jgi:hypothetical protein
VWLIVATLGIPASPEMPEPSTRSADVTAFLAPEEGLSPMPGAVVGRHGRPTSSSRYRGPEKSTS